MTKLLRELALDVLGQPWLARLLASGTGPRCVILMLHRFGSADGERGGHDRARLRQLLGGLRKSKIALVGLDEAISAMRGADAGGPLPRRSVAFTVDDGYVDFVETGVPVFTEYDCPVTGFVVPGIMDGLRWFWWDQIDWVMRESALRSITAVLQERPITVSWGDPTSRKVERNRLVEQLKSVQHTELLRFIREFARAGDVSLDTPTPERYRLLEWDELRAAERKGVRFGAHSMTHPILSRCTAEQSAFEISESVRRVNQELVNSSKVFCYPNGQANDFGYREMASVRSAGLDAALSSQPGVIRYRTNQALDENWRLAVPRFASVDHPGYITRFFLG